MQILSRTRLERLIDEFKLYTQERQQTIMEEIVQHSRENIDVSMFSHGAELGGFRVAFTGEDPRTVMRVTDRFASLFIEEHPRP